MKNIFFLFIVFNLLLFSCNNDDESSKEKENEIQNLTEMHDEIISESMANTTSCTDSEEWSFTAIGSKACGGSTRYIPYSLKINVAEFLKKVENYTNAEAAYNKKWGIISNCYAILPPSRVDCVDGKPTLIYSDILQ